MKKCSIIKVKKGEKTYLKARIEYGDNKTFDFAIKPMFLSKKAYVTLLRLSDNEEK